MENLKNELIEEIIYFLETNKRFRLFSLNVSAKPNLEKLNTDELKNLYNFTQLMM